MINSPYEAMSIVSAFISMAYDIGAIFDNELKLVEEAESYLEKYILEKEKGVE